jgi:HSP20 family protein
MGSIPKDLPELLKDFQQQMDELFQRLFSLEKRGNRVEREHYPVVDCFETADSYVVEVELPGFEREDLKLSMLQNRLMVEGAKREDEKDKTISYICLERKFGRFCRTVEIPPMVDVSGVRARYCRGVLSVMFPKMSEARTPVINIPID